MMTNLTRRGFLNGSTSVILTSKALPFGAFLSSATASSEATAALLAAGLAAAAFAASTIAAHNRGDGGLSAMLSANFELLKIAIVKLDDIQNRLTDVYIKLMSLPSEIDDLLKQEATRKLHVEMLGVVRGYAEKLQNRDPLINFSDWQKDSRTIVDLSDLLARLQKARQEINVQDLADPSTALIASTAGFVETNIKNILGYRIYNHRDHRPRLSTVA
jgi:hypothetical protein